VAKTSLNKEIYREGREGNNDWRIDGFHSKTACEAALYSVSENDYFTSRP